MEKRPWVRNYDYNVPETIRYPRIPCHELLQIPSNTFPDKPAINFYGTEITFWQLRLMILRMANALGTEGVKKGDRVGIHLPAEQPPPLCRPRLQPPNQAGAPTDFSTPDEPLHGRLQS